MASLLVQLGLFYLATASASLVSRQIQLGENEYFLPPTSSWKLKSWDSDGFKDEFTPLTVVQLKDTANAERVAAALEQYNKTDDVWTPSFAQVLYVEGSGSAKWLKDLPSEYNASAVVYSDESAAPGPYFVQTATGDVFQAYRLYPDTNQAFIQSSYQDPSGTHHPLRAASFSAGGLTVAVPSRLYYTPTKDKPLAGVRIGVKDLYDLKGLKTSGGNRALYEMSNVKNETAFAVQKLIDAGATVVGKNKLSEFAFAGAYVPEHIDYLLPFNPRGDGYQSPGDSSGGSAAAAASYDWLDASMGSDTGGSIRGPAAGNGAHGNRPTWGAVDLTGALPLSTAMDTSGMIARDPIVWSKINRALYAGTIKEYKLLPEIILLDPDSKQALSQLEEETPEIVTAAENFLNSLSKILSANVTTFSIDKAWSRSAPDDFKAAPIAGLTTAVYGNLTRYEQWTEFGKGYVEEYMDSHNGEFPHMTWGTRNGWLTANRTMNEETHKRDLKIKKGVQDWVGSHFLTSEDDTCSNAVYVYFNVPNKDYKPDVSTDPSNPWIIDLNNQITQQQQTILELEKTINCNTTLGSEKACEESIAALEPADGPPDSVSPGRLASVAGLPDYAITLGSFDRGEATFSNSTLKTQKLPLAVDIVAARGCDCMILDIVEKLNREGVIKKVNTVLESLPLRQDVALFVVIAVGVVWLLFREFIKKSPAKSQEKEFTTPLPPPLPDFDLDGTKPQLYRPFRHGPNHVTMGIRKLDWDNWIEMDSNFLPYHDIKVSELEKDLAAHVQYVDNAVTRDACFEVLEELSTFLTARYPKMFQLQGGFLHNTVTGEKFKYPATNPTDALTIAAKLVQDDLIVMVQNEDGQYHLDAGAVCLPGFWRLREKFRMSLDTLHIEAKKGLSYETIMGDQNSNEVASWATANDVGLTIDYLYFRSERQSLRRLPRSKALLFTVRTYFEPITTIAKEPHVPGRLAEAIEQWDEPTSTYKGKHHWAGILLPYLHEQDQMQKDSGLLEKMVEANYPF
ncbi:hypothetical protein FDECE_9835 [Fusarium decemcellulare]|nr:hypothetical protein FDECE_9835 [Fusarium decemcellulare]